MPRAKREHEETVKVSEEAPVATTQAAEEPEVFDILAAEAEMKAAEEGRWFTPVGKTTRANGAPRPSAVSLLVLGSDSSASRQAYRDAYKKKLADLAELPEEERTRPLTLEEEDALEIAVAVAITKDWKGVKLGPDPAPCTNENKVRFYTSSPMTARQVTVFSGNKARFMEP